MSLIILESVLLLLTSLVLQLSYYRPCTIFQFKNEKFFPSFLYWGSTTVPIFNLKIKSFLLFYVLGYTVQFFK